MDACPRTNIYLKGKMEMSSPEFNECVRRIDLAFDSYTRGIVTLNELVDTVVGRVYWYCLDRDDPRDDVELLEEYVTEQLGPLTADPIVGDRLALLRVQRSIAVATRRRIGDAETARLIEQLGEAPPSPGTAAWDELVEICRSGSSTHRQSLGWTENAKQILRLAHSHGNTEALWAAINPDESEVGQLAPPRWNWDCFVVAINLLANLAADPFSGTSRLAINALISLTAHQLTAAVAAVRIPAHHLEDEDLHQLRENLEHHAQKIECDPTFTAGPECHSRSVMTLQSLLLHNVDSQTCAERMVKVADIREKFRCREFAASAELAGSCHGDGLVVSDLTRAHDEKLAMLDQQLDEIEARLKTTRLDGVHALETFCGSARPEFDELVVWEDRAKHAIKLAHRFRVPTALGRALNSFRSAGGQIAHTERAAPEVVLYALDALAHLATEPEHPSGLQARAELIALIGHPSVAGLAATRLPLHLMTEAESREVMESQVKLEDLERSDDSFTIDEPDSIGTPDIVRSVLWAANDARRVADER